jgi:hypothetical protein
MSQLTSHKAQLQGCQKQQLPHQVSIILCMQPTYTCLYMTSSMQHFNAHRHPHAIAALPLAGWLDKQPPCVCALAHTSATIQANHSKRQPPCNYYAAPILPLPHHRPPRQSNSPPQAESLQRPRYTQQHAPRNAWPLPAHAHPTLPRPLHSQSHPLCTTSYNTIRPGPHRTPAIPATAPATSKE